MYVYAPLITRLVRAYGTDGLVVAMDLHHFGKPDLDPHKRSEPDPHQVKSRLRCKAESWGGSTQCTSPGSLPLKPYCGSTVLRLLILWSSDPDSIRSVDPSLNPGAQKWPAKIEKNYATSCFEVLDVLFWGLKAFSVPVAWTSCMEA